MRAKDTKLDEDAEECARIFRSQGKPAAVAKMRELAAGLKVFEAAVLQDKVMNALRPGSSKEDRLARNEIWRTGRVKDALPEPVPMADNASDLESSLKSARTLMRAGEFTSALKAYKDLEKVAAAAGDKEMARAAHAGIVYCEDFAGKKDVDKEAKDSLESEAAEADRRDAKAIREAAAKGASAEEIARKCKFPLQFVKDVIAGKAKDAALGGDEEKLCDRLSRELGLSYGEVAEEFMKTTGTPKRRYEAVRAKLGGGKAKDMDNWRAYVDAKDGSKYVSPGFATAGEANAWALKEHPGQPFVVKKSGGKATDSLMQAKTYEVRGDRARALDAYQAAIREARAKNDASSLGEARDGVRACQAFAEHYRHPAAGKRQAFGDRVRALDAAVLRTRAGERVRVTDAGEVVPGRDASPKEKLDKAYEKWQDAMCDEECAKGEGIKGARLDDFDRRTRAARAEYRLLRQRHGLEPYQIGGHEKAGAKDFSFTKGAAQGTSAALRTPEEVARVYSAKPEAGFKKSFGKDDGLRPVGNDSEHDENVAELASRIKQVVKQQRADGTSSMSKANLKQMVSSRGLRFANPNHFERSFEQALQQAAVGRFVHDRAKDEHEGFEKLERSLAHEKGVKDPAALAASIGRKKYGAAGMAKKAAAGRAKDAVSKVYTPTIITRIPADIDPSKHGDIERRLETARQTLHNRDSYSREAAMELAARAIAKSGVGACAYPSVKVTARDVRTADRELLPV